MSYYADLFLRPKQAMQYANEHPSLLRSLAFVFLGAVAGLLSSFFLLGTIWWDSVLGFLLVDILRWVLAGLILVLFTIIFSKKSFSKEGFLRVLSMLSHINVYGFFMFLMLALLLPAVAIPDILAAAPQLANGNIGQEEWAAILSASIGSYAQNEFNPIIVPIVLLGLLFWLYALYGMYLATHQFLQTTAFKTIIAMLIVVFVQGFVLVLIA
ncbi:MAG: hypothetical protein V1776_02315 [Candidatus Diapherotrites archaeon]